MALDYDRPVVFEGNLEDFVDRFVIAKTVQREGEQSPLDVKGHQSRRYVQTHQPCVQPLPAEQGHEIRRVVRDKHVTVIDGPPHDRPIPARTQPKPRDMHRFHVATIVRERDQ
jgi:hypothetical protein